MSDNRRVPIWRRLIRKGPPGSASQETEGQRHARHGYQIAVVMAVSMALVSIFALVTVSSDLPAMEYPADLIPLGIGLCAAFSAWLIRNKQTNAGLGLLLSAIYIGVLLEPLFSMGYGTVIGTSAFLIGAAVAGLALPARRAPWIVAISFTVGVAAVIIDQFGPAGRIPGAPYFQRLFPILALITIVVIVWMVVRQYRRFSLRTRLIAVFVLLVLSPLGLLTWMNNVLTQQALIEAANQTLMAAALQTANSLDSYFNALSDSLATEARLPAFQEYLSLPDEERLQSAQEGDAATLLRNLQQRAGNISYTLLDRHGTVLLDTTTGDVSKLPHYMGLDKVDNYSFYTTLLTGVPYVSPVVFPSQASNVDLKTTEPAFFIAAAVLNDLNQPLGALLVGYPASILQNLVEKSNQLAGEHSFGVLVDENYLRLANGHDAEQIYTTLIVLDNAEIARLYTIQRLPKESIPLPANELPELAEAIHSAAPSTFFAGELGSSHVEEVAAGLAEDTDIEQAAITTLQSRRWYVVYAKPQEVFLAPAAQLTRASVLAVIVVAVASTLVAAALAQIITRPVRQLTGVAQKITGGDLQAQAAIGSQDEVGTLAAAFNTMTAQLRASLSGLETRVAERTAELGQATEQMRRRATQLQQVAEITHTIAAEQNLDALFDQLTQQISQRFGFYHVGIFMLDTAGEYAVLRAANSEGGKRMLARGHRLRVGQVGIVGFVCAAKEPRIALDVGQDAVFFDNPDLPFTRSEIALPLVFGGKIIGALDVQSTQPSAFSQEDVSLLFTLANQVAIAIQNANQFNETRRALQELQLAQRQYLSTEWSRQVAERQMSGYRYVLGQLTPVAAAGQEHLWAALEQGEQSALFQVSSVARPLETEPNSLAIPISLRGQIIGAIELADIDRQRQWTEEEIAFVRSLAEQVGLALENARLLEETQRRAEREHLVSEITTRLRASNDTQTILQTAMSELRRALHVKDARVLIQEKPAPNPPADNSPSGNGGSATHETP